MRPFVCVTLLIFVSPAWAAFCAHWEAGKEIGTLSPKDFREASGMAASASHPDRLYWANDGGGKPEFFYTNSLGKNTVRVKIEPNKPRDIEAVSMTVCPEGPCIALGDIGDNSGHREHVRVYFIPEQNDFGASVRIKREIKLEYPDGPHDAEAMAFTPAGDFIIVTKEFKKPGVGPAQVFTIAHDEWIKGTADKSMRLKKLGEIELTKLIPDAFFLGHLVTDMAVNARRQVFVLLTYTHAIEIPLTKIKDLSSEWKKDRDYALLPLEALNQQESVTYTLENDRILWSSEYLPPAAPIFSMTCARFNP